MLLRQLDMGKSEPQYTKINFDIDYRSKHKAKAIKLQERNIKKTIL